MGTIFYPNNAKLQRRANKLARDCRSYNEQTEELNKKITSILEESQDIIQLVMDKNGLTSEIQIIEKVKGQLTGEEKEKYDMLVENGKDENGTIEKSVVILSSVALHAGNSILLTKTLSTLVETGMLSLHARLTLASLLYAKKLNFAKAFEVFEQNWKWGSKQLLFTAKRYIRPGTIKVFNAISKISKILGVASVLLEGVLLGVSIYEAAKRKDKLQADIAELWQQRLLLRFLFVNLRETLSFYQSAKDYAHSRDFWRQSPLLTEAQIDKLVQSDYDYMVKNCDKFQTKKKFADIAYQLEVIDTKRQAYTEGDPSYADVKNKIDALTPEYADL